MSGLLRGLWRRISQPSLVRRLLLAQLLLLTLLWTMFTGYITYETGNDQAALHEENLYKTALAVADNLAGQPERRHQTLALLDAAATAGYGMGDPILAVSMLVSQDGREIFRSPKAPEGARHVDVPGKVVVMGTGERRWRARTMRAPDTGSLVTVMTPAGGWFVFVTLNSRGFYLLPLVLSLPLLVLPAWLSIRLALRPWSNVAREVATRGPHNLAALGYSDRHQELSDMVDSINTLMQSVAESQSRERSFIADAAHELRTPLAAMRVNVEALLGQAGEGRDRTLLSGIVSSVKRATRLVSQLLTLMRSDATAGDETERVALDELLQDRLAVLSGLAAARGVELELAAEPDVAVQGQRESLISLVDNLVENAIKYGPEGGVVRVALRRAGVPRGVGGPAPLALLAVEDQGPGIAPALRQRVFDRFFRDPAQSQGGSGLGLAIAQAAAARHGGQVALLDGEEGGLLVEVTLPLAK
ncbi:HAMP domain-containing sensor histidine kinase [Massilia sp. Root351]|uniref:sensor histidine kinase n=1 Tax=Massilia sp. Root351 TaxID=1736522 RepID=UPI000ABE1689|nr:ATP-binding protein [Massilia sp. Root351]